MGREEKGLNRGKMVKGRKRSIFVDILGLLCGLSVSSANQSENEGAIECLSRTPYEMRRLKKILFDGGEHFEKLIEEVFKCKAEIVKRKGKGFEVQAFRLIVERTFSWFEGFRGLSKDYEMKVQHSES